MNRSLKSLLALLILICLAASILGWSTPGIQGVPTSRYWMRFSGLLLVPATALLLWSELRRDLAPDFLRKLVKRYFEQNGFCFVILPSVQKDRFAWAHSVSREPLWSDDVPGADCIFALGEVLAGARQIRRGRSAAGDGVRGRRIRVGLRSLWFASRLPGEKIAIRISCDCALSKWQRKNAAIPRRHARRQTPQPSIADTAHTTLSVLAFCIRIFKHSASSSP